MRVWLIISVVLAACGGSGGAASDDTDADSRVDPWLDDLVVGPISDIGENRVSGVPWFGFGEGPDPLAVLELRDDLRPLGQSLVRLGDSPQVLLTAEELIAEVDQDGILEVRADRDGYVAFRTAGGCLGWFAQQELDLRCDSDWGTVYQGPLLGGHQPVLAVQADRASYVVGTWTGGWGPLEERGSGQQPILEWAINEQGQLFVTSEFFVQEVVEGGRLRLADIREQTVWPGASPGSARFRGLTIGPEGRPHVLMTGTAGEPQPGVGIYRLDGEQLVLLADLTAPVVDGQRLAFLGTGGEPGLSWGLADDGTIVFLGELEDGRQGVYVGVADGFVERVASGQPATDRWGDALPGVTLSALGSAVMGGEGEVVFTAIVSGEGITADNRYGVWVALPSGRTVELARTGSRMPDSTQMIERLNLHGGRLQFPDPRDENPAVRRSVPDAGNDNDNSLVMWGAQGWNRSVLTEQGCTRVLLGLESADDEALVLREVGEGC